MNIDLSKIEQIYGIDICEEIKNNYDEVMKNAYYMESLGFSDTEDYIERVPLLFLNTNSEFKNKLDNLKKSLGDSFIEKIEEDISLMEDLL